MGAISFPELATSETDPGHQRSDLNCHSARWLRWPERGICLHSLVNQHGHWSLRKFLLYHTLPRMMWVRVSVHWSLMSCQTATCCDQARWISAGALLTAAKSFMLSSDTSQATTSSKPDEANWRTMPSICASCCWSTHVNPLQSTSTSPAETADYKNNNNSNIIL